jgi:hypothetical protein
MKFYGVPITLNKTHEIATDDFCEAQKRSLPLTPPNAFRFFGKNKSGIDLWNSTCIVGASRRIGFETQTIFDASIPGGYIEVINLSQRKSTSSNYLSSSDFNRVLQRCREIQPRTTEASLKALLDTYGSNAHHASYICLPDGNPNAELVMQSERPLTYSGVSPDGVPPATIKRIKNEHINPADGALPTGDRPCTWTPSSGFGNLLGQLVI